MNVRILTKLFSATLVSAALIVTALLNFDSGLLKSDRLDTLLRKYNCSVNLQSPVINREFNFSNVADDHLFVSVPQLYGRLGNNIFQLASAYGIARTAGKRVHIKNSSVLLDLFPAIRKHEYFYKSDLKTRNCLFVSDFTNHSKFLPSIVSVSRVASNISMIGYFQSWRYFDAYRDELLELLRFNESIEKAADRRINVIEKKVRHSYFSYKSVSEVIWIGVHIRRGDMALQNVSTDGFAVATAEYLNKAATYFIYKYRNSHRGLVFLVFSDDFKWARRHFSFSTDASINSPHVYVEYVTNQSREIDLTMMRRCNATIMTVGSFGWWAAYLAGGETFYYAFPFRVDSEYAAGFTMDDYYPQHWRLLY